MTRINLETMPPLEAYTVMGGGNPGALTALTGLVKYHEQQNAEAVGWVRIIQLDEMGIYGAAIWHLFSDYCKQSMDVFDTVINNNDVRIVDFLNEHPGRGDAEPVRRRSE